jgi:hypothetical protein
VQPNPPTPPIIQADGGINQSTANALNAFLTNQATCNGYGWAVVASIDKASGAEAAGNMQWRDQQVQAARNFALAWSEELEPSRSLRVEAAAQLASQGIGTSGTDFLEMIRIREEILNTGWPQLFRDLMDQYGIRGADQADALDRMTLGLMDLERLSKSPVAILADTVPEHEASEDDIVDIIAGFGNG